MNDIHYGVSTDPINNPTPYHALDVARAPLALSSAAIIVTSGLTLMLMMFQYWSGHERQRCITSVVCSFATQLQHLFGYFNVLSMLSSYIVDGTASDTLSRFWAAVRSAICFEYGDSAVGGRQTGTLSQTIKPLCRNIINPHVSRLVCILYVIVFGMGHVLALDTCVIYMCTESSGAIAVYLTDTSPGCVSPAQNYMISKCGVNYSGRTCYVDCNSIYSWSGSYWRAAGCNGLGNPCGVQTECDSSVLNVCPA